MPGQGMQDVSEAANPRHHEFPASSQASNPSRAPEEKPSALRGFVLPRRNDLDSLTGVYFEHSNFFSPIINQDGFKRSVDMIYDSGGGQLLSDLKATSRICIVLATSVRLRNCTDSTFSISPGERYFAAATAMHEMRPRLFWTGDLDHLEYLLLIVQYAMFASDLALCSQYLTLATRLAISLGLHLPTQCESPSEENEFSPIAYTATIHPRRLWLFWATYNLERNLSSPLQMPTTIPDDDIQVSLPPNPRNDHMKALAIHILRHRQVESEIQKYRSEISRPDKSTADLRDWRSQIHSRLVQLKEQRPIFIKPTTLVPPDVFDGLFTVAIVRLYSPGPRPIAHLDDPTSTMTLVRSAVKCIATYKKTFREGRLRFFWRTIHNIYLCGSALVHGYKLLSSLASPCPGVDLEELKYSMTICSAVLWGMAERYPAGTRFRDDFDDLVAGILHTRLPVNYVDFLDIPGNPTYGRNFPNSLSDGNAFDELEFVQ